MVKVKVSKGLEEGYLSEILDTPAVNKIIEEVAMRVLDNANATAMDYDKSIELLDFYYGMYLFEGGKYGSTAVIWPSSRTAMENPWILKKEAR